MNQNLMASAPSATLKAPKPALDITNTVETKAESARKLENLRAKLMANRQMNPSRNMTASSNANNNSEMASHPDTPVDFTPRKSSSTNHLPKAAVANPATPTSNTRMSPSDTNMSLDALLAEGKATADAQDRAKSPTTNGSRNSLHTFQTKADQAERHPVQSLSQDLKPEVKVLGQTAEEGNNSRPSKPKDVKESNVETSKMVDNAQSTDQRAMETNIHNQKMSNKQNSTQEQQASIQGPQAIMETQPDSQGPQPTSKTSSMVALPQQTAEVLPPSKPVVKVETKTYMASAPVLTTNKVDDSNKGQYPDLELWLQITGYHNPMFREKKLKTHKLRQALVEKEKRLQEEMAELERLEAEEAAEDVSHAQFVRAQSMFVMPPPTISASAMKTVEASSKDEQMANSPVSLETKAGAKRQRSPEHSRDLQLPAGKMSRISSQTRQETENQSGQTEKQRKQKLLDQPLSSGARSNGPLAR